MKKTIFLNLLMLFFASSFFAADIYVSSAGDDTTGDGTSGNPYQTLHQAVIAAADGDNIIIVGAVSQTVTTTIGKNLTFTGNSNASVTITGTARLFIVNSAITLTFTDITFQDISSAGGSVLTTSGGASTTFTNCIFKNNSSSAGNGGALFIDGSNVTTTNCVFDSNSTNGGGGAIGLAGAGTFTATGTTFYNNSTANQGGAIRMINTAEATITNCTFFGNNISKNSIVDGGAIRVNATGNTLTVSNSLFYNNTSTTATEPNETTDVNGVTGATIDITNSLAQSTNNIDITTGSNLTSDLTNSNLTWNTTSNRIEFTAPDAITDATPIDFGNDASDVGAWDSKINIFKGGATGAVEAWTTATNWSNSALPTATDNVAILTGAACTLNGEATINDIKVTTRLDIKNDRVLIINGDATVTGNVNYLRNLTNSAVLTEAWHLVSSPFSGEVFDDTFVTNNDIAVNNSNNGIASYNSGQTGSAAWTYLTSGGSINANNGQGYSMKITPDGVSTGDERADNIVSFQGDFNTNDAGVTTASLSTGFNLVGNPYTSFVNSATFLGDNANIDQTQIWVWNATSGAYEVKIAGDAFVLAPAQGFFVDLTSAGTLNFAEANQATTGASFLKSSRTEAKLIMSDGTNNRYAKIYFTNTASKGFDFGWEGEIFGGIANSLSIFTELIQDNQGKKHQIQSLPIAEMETMIVPVGIKAAAGKVITFTAEAMNLPSDLKVFLEDRETNTITRLDEANTSYKVTLSDALDGTGRFYLHTKASNVLSTSDAILQNISVYTKNNATLRVVGLPSGSSNLKMYNILGKQVMRSSFSSTGVKEISLPKLATGMYIIQLETATGKLNKKIVLE